jgi:UDP-N-acetyl-D-mannosaminuronic acid dehydrogenase
MKFDQVCVLGLGYIGLPTASIFATQGLHVVGVDNNPQVVSTLRNGALHISEPGLDALVREAISAGRLMIKETPEPADAFVIAVPTPFYSNERKTYAGKEYRLADMRAVTAATRSILPHLHSGNLVVLESTSPPRTTVDLVQPILEESGLKAGVDFLLAYSPERVLPGRIIQELTENARVIGGINPASSEAGRDLYAHFVRGEIVLTDATTAEMVKLMENTYRDVNIAIANEFSRLAERFGVNIWQAISIANRHPRVKILNPGPGVGGHCVSVDPWFLVEAAPDLTELIATARRVNDSQPHFVFDLVSRCLGNELSGKKICILGLAFKPDVDDLRESPAIDVARMLAETGAHVSAYEPYKPDAFIPGVKLSASLEDAIHGVEVICLLAGHKQFIQLDPVWVKQVSSARYVIDTVGGWDKDSWVNAGFAFLRLGVGEQHL